MTQTPSDTPEAANPESADTDKTQAEAKAQPEVEAEAQAEAAAPNADASDEQASAKPRRNRNAPWSVNDWVVAPVEGKKRFHDFELHETLMRGIANLGFEYCSPIQAETLPHSLAGWDVIGKAQTGTGKTAAFLTSIFQYLLTHPVAEDERYASEPRALIVAPTRELALQIAKDAKQLGRYTSLDVTAVVGGMNYQKQLQKLQTSVVDILVATPGRLLDFCSKKEVFLDLVDILVIDEADRMLDMGFIPDLKQIIRRTPRKHERQTLLFSATFPQDVLNLSRSWTDEPITIEIESESQTAERVDQVVYMVPTEDKACLLANLLRADEVQQVIVFANRRDESRDLFAYLKKQGFNCALLSGEIPQNQRLKTLDRFKAGDIKVLVATDVAGRGLHVEDISHVVNFNLPEDPEDYVHRIGRTGRAGKSGVSISFACEDDAFLLPDLESFIGKTLECQHPAPELLKEPGDHSNSSAGE